MSDFDHPEWLAVGSRVEVVRRLVDDLSDLLGEVRRGVHDG